MHKIIVSIIIFIMFGNSVAQKPSDSLIIMGKDKNGCQFTLNNICIENPYKELPEIYGKNHNSMVYHKKAARMRYASIALFAIGGAFIITGISTNSNYHSLSETSAPTTFLVSGGLCVAVSITLFTMGKRSLQHAVRLHNLQIQKQIRALKS